MNDVFSRLKLQLLLPILNKISCTGGSKSHTFRSYPDQHTTVIHAILLKRVFCVVSFKQQWVFQHSLATQSCQKAQAT